MNTYFLKISGQHQGPYSEQQIAVMFEHSQVNRNTPCRRTTDQQWKTIDDYLPTLKYGVQLPPSPPSPSPGLNAGADQHRFSLVDIDLPFASILRLMFKCFGAGLIIVLPIAGILGLLWFVIVAILLGAAGHMLSSPPRP